MKSSKTLLYLLAAIITGTAFQVFASSLSKYMWAIPMLFINVISLITLIGYGRIELLFKQTETDLQFEDSLSLLTAMKKGPVPILIMGFLSFAQFAIMLPWITTQSAAIYFLLAASVARVIIIPISIRVFGDQLGSRRTYIIGFSLAIIGVLIYQWDSISTIHNHLGFLLSSLVFMLLILLNTTLQRFFTSKPNKPRRTNRILGIKYVYIPVVSRARWTLILESFGYAAVVLFAMINGNLTFQLENFPLQGAEMISILWIGVVVIIAMTLGQRFKNDIGETVTGALEGYRPLIALVFIVPVVNFVFGTNEIIGYYEITGAIIATIGAMISGLAKPKTDDDPEIDVPSVNKEIERNGYNWKRLEEEEIFDFDEEIQNRFLDIAKNAFGNYTWSTSSYRRTFVQKNNYAYVLLDENNEKHGFVIVEIPPVDLEGKQFVFLRKIALDDSVKGKRLGLRFFIEEFKKDNFNVHIAYIGLKTQSPYMMRAIKNICKKTYPFEDNYLSEEGANILKFVQTNTLELTDNIDFDKRTGILNSCYGQKLGNYDLDVPGVEDEEEYLQKHDFNREQGDALLLIGKIN